MKRSRGIKLTQAGPQVSNSVRRQRRFIMHQLRCIGMLMLPASAVLWIAATGAASAADFPKGIFTLKGPDTATWAVKFDGKDKFTVTRDGKEGVEGTYKVTKDEIEFTD